MRCRGKRVMLFGETGLKEYYVNHFVWTKAELLQPATRKRSNFWSYSLRILLIREILKEFFWAMFFRKSWICWQGSGRDYSMKIVFIKLIRFYQKFISPMFPPSCRFYPTCSEYAVQALSKYGAFKGGLMAMWRILRCNPFNKGGFDPVE